jgi:cytochrome c oxidase subunit 3/cytochrome o ubiquinol oxidase subunit 3
MVYKGRDTTGPRPHEEWLLNGKLVEPMLEIKLVTIGTALLLFSSLFVVLALAGAQSGNRKMLIGWLSATIMCGLFFIGMQAYEFTHFVQRGMGFTTNLFSSSFFTLTGFHGGHVTLGVLWLISVLIYALRGKLTPEKAVNLEIAALYWHFVDVVWIVIFPVVYLIK